MLQILTSLVVPAALIALAFVGYPLAAKLPAGQQAVVAWLPLVIAGVSTGLSLRFNHSRMFFSLLTLTLAWAVLRWYLPAATMMDAAITFEALCLLAPFNLLVFSLLKERGMFTWWGATRFALLLLPPAIIAALSQAWPVEMLTVLRWRLFDWDLLNQAPFSQPAQLMMLVAALVLNGRVFMQPCARNSALFGVLAGLLAMLYYRDNAAAVAVFACAITLLPAIAVVQESWSMAYIDPLTNLPGRRALNERLLKLGGRYAIAMLDIDHFKRFNDRHGHDAGDEVLRMVASHIRAVGAGGKAFRYGGEEFCILFPGKEVAAVFDALDDLRKQLAAKKFRLRRKDRRQGPARRKAPPGKQVNVSISIGVAGRGERAPLPHDVMQAADQALYRAKGQGRNRVCK